VDGMTEREYLAQQFEENRGRLRGVAYRMLGSLNEADDAVQEAWLRLNRSDAGDIDNLGGWLTTVVARVCLDMLRSRGSRREESLSAQDSEPVAPRQPATDPEQEALLADSVGLALLVVLDRLTPAERLAFVLHDLFAMSFDEIAPIIGKSTTAARQLASRARRRVQGKGSAVDADLAQQRPVVDRFLAAVRAGDFEGLMSVLDPDLVVHLDPAAVRSGAPREVHGAEAWAKGAVAFAAAFADLARSTTPALINGKIGAISAPGGRLLRALNLVIKDGKVVEIEIIADPAHLRGLDLSILSD
jgi:RNA polymerase sigma factor (sigma-70 family)